MAVSESGYTHWVAPILSIGGLGDSLLSSFNNSAPDYFVGLNLNIPLRNRVAKADQYRSELEYRQAQLREEQLKKQIRIEVRNAQYALEQTEARVGAAQKARDLADRTFEITKKEQTLGAGSSYQTLTSQRDLAVAELDLVTARTIYEKAKVELDRATGTTLEHNGILIQDAINGYGERSRSIAEMQNPTKSAEMDISQPNMRPTERAPRVLAADDQQHILEAIELLLRPQGYEVDTANSPVLVREALATGSYDAVLIDLNYSRDTTSGREGLDLLSEITSLDSSVPVIVMTAWGNVELAVEAMRRGARDFIQKPWENERLLTILRTQVELHRTLQQAERLTAENRLLRAQGRPEFIATAPSMQTVLEAITRIGPSDANVLITGEHGSGKEVVAQTLHALSPRAARTLVAVNTGALPDGIFESELFGHVKGAFTDARNDRIGRFELADGGTIFLDEIGNVPMRQQAKLLRVLESGEIERLGSSRTRKVDVRVISATNTDLRAGCASGQFREDLLFRLNTVEIHVPPLRERREDIAALAVHFLARYASRYRRPVTGFDAAALQQLLQHSWPGNVRELEHTLERAVLMCRTHEIQASDLGLNLQRAPSQNLEELSLESVEAILIRKALQRFQGNVSQAAEALGLSRGALYRRMEKYGL